MDMKEIFDKVEARTERDFTLLTPVLGRDERETLGVMKATRVMMLASFSGAMQDAEDMPNVSGG